MVGEWMMNSIKIPWFRRPRTSWSLVYLVRGGSRLNFTEGSLLAAIDCIVQGYLVDLGSKPPSSEGLSYNRLPVMSFGGKTAITFDVQINVQIKSSAVQKEEFGRMQLHGSRQRKVQRLRVKVGKARGMSGSGSGGRRSVVTHRTVAGEMEKLVMG
ncbi:hypothetical protein M5K25_007249 [Dendrobium thyrsiflorum]|uniref:Uncharacterized protein n=1 Tax=Dendrobium thyrsiflorum TaxID=117978 RepID=A0ABD0VDV5_DENTH